MGQDPLPHSSKFQISHVEGAVNWPLPVCPLGSLASTISLNLQCSVVPLNLHCSAVVKDEPAMNWAGLLRILQNMIQTDAHLAPILPLFLQVAMFPLACAESLAPAVEQLWQHCSLNERIVRINGGGASKPWNQWPKASSPDCLSPTAPTSQLLAVIAQ